MVDFWVEIMENLHLLDVSGTIRPNEKALKRLLDIYSEVKNEQVSLCCDSNKVYRFFKSLRHQWRINQSKEKS